MFANNHGDGHVAVWVPAAPGVQADLIEEAPDTYFRPPYVGGGGWVGVELTSVDDERLGADSRSVPSDDREEDCTKSRRAPSTCTWWQNTPASTVTSMT
jgi:hypothetical protein